MPSVLIVGAGFGGIAAAIELRRHGITDVRILEKADEYGGTWFHNTYPGAACDVPSHAYSFSFSQRRDWVRLCPTQPDILRYLHEVVAEQGLEPIIETGTHVSACRWDEAARRWTVQTSRGERTADALIVATGQLHQPATPALEGEFAGHSFHSAEWDHGYDLRGKRVAVVGTGASAVQFVPPVAEQAAHTTVFQRTGNWFLPRRNRAYPRAYRALIERVPARPARPARVPVRLPGGPDPLHPPPAHVRARARAPGRGPSCAASSRTTPSCASRIWPDYTIGCKRVLFSSTFLPALARDDVEVVTEPIERLAPGGDRHP